MNTLEENISASLTNKKLEYLENIQVCLKCANFKFGVFNGKDIYQISKELEDRKLEVHKKKYFPLINLAFKIGAFVFVLLIGTAFLRLGLYIVGSSYKPLPFIPTLLLKSLPYPTLFFGMFRMWFAVVEGKADIQVEENWRDAYKVHLQAIKNWGHNVGASGLTLRAFIGTHTKDNEYDKELSEDIKQKIEALRQEAFQALKNLKIQAEFFDKFMKTSKNADLFVHTAVWDVNFKHIKFIDLFYK